GLAAQESAAQASAYQVIVHPSNTIPSVRRTFLADAYLKKVTRWPDDRVIRPADLASSSQARVRFSFDVLGRSVDAVKAYWQRRIFSGQAVPPPEFAKDAEVVSYVLEHPSAVGYISTGGDVRGVRVVPITH
ncbi:MAG: hypothetical protein RL685_6402, partial [Pseudomonadota bacterium]